MGLGSGEYAGSLYSQCHASQLWSFGNSGTGAPVYRLMSAVFSQGEYDRLYAFSVPVFELAFTSHDRAF